MPDTGKIVDMWTLLFFMLLENGDLFSHLT